MGANAIGSSELLLIGAGRPGARRDPGAATHEAQLAGCAPTPPLPDAAAGPESPATPSACSQAAGRAASAARLARRTEAAACCPEPLKQQASGLYNLFVPEKGICFAALKRLGPVELCALGALNQTFRRLMDDQTMDVLWARFYGHHFHMTDQDATRFVGLRPKQIFSRLATLSISGKWHVTGRVTQMEHEVENAYGYVQFFTERERVSPIESSFEGEVEDDESAFLVEGKMVGNSLVMYETITNHSNVPIAVNICSGVLSLQGSFMSGVWTQHNPNPSASRVLSGTISSGVFEATKLDEAGGGAVPPPALA